MKLTALMAAVALAASPALAVPITGELSINGADSFTSTQINFIGSGNVQGTSGSFAELANCGLCVTMINTLTPATSGTLYTVSDGGLTASLSINPPTTFTQGGTVSLPDLTASGTGSISLSGFDDTPGVWELTTQGPTGASVTFSATTVGTPPPSVPEPPAYALICAALLGLVAVRKRWIGV